MKVNESKWIVAAGILMSVLTACSSGTAATAPLTRVATQTPWIIYVPVTVTPEPATVTPLPTITESRPSRTPTRAAARATATKAPPTAAPVAAAPSATPVPACSLGSVNLIFPENGAPRNTRKDGSGGSAFDFKWTPYQPGESDPQTGYRIDIESKRGSQHVNGAAVYVSHNKFLRDGLHYIYDQRSVSSLAAGESATVIWKVTVVKTTGGFDDQGGVTGTVVNCGAPSQTWQIQLIVPD